MFGSFTAITNPVRARSKALVLSVFVIDRNRPAEITRALAAGSVADVEPR